MVPRIHQLTLGVQCACHNDRRQARDNVSAIASGNEAFDDDVIPPSFALRAVARMLAEDKGQCPHQESNNE
jgi:hypothetical protein